MFIQTVILIFNDCRFFHISYCNIRHVTLVKPGGIAAVNVGEMFCKYKGTILRYPNYGTTV